MNLAPASAFAVIDALTAHVALLDNEGEIVAVNEAWKRFSDANGSRLPGYGIGSVTGCGGTLSGNVYTVPSVTAACTITASFVRLGGPPPALVPVNGWQMLLLMMGLLLGGALIALRRGG